MWSWRFENKKKIFLVCAFYSLECGAVVLTSLHRYFCENVRSENLQLVWPTQGISCIQCSQSENVAHSVRWHAFCPRRAITAVHIGPFSNPFFFSSRCSEVKIRRGSRVAHFIVNYLGMCVCAQLVVAQTQKRSHRSV